MKFTRVLGKIHVSSGQIIVGDLNVPLPGVKVEGVPKGTFDVSAVIDEEDYIWSFEIVFEQNTKADLETLTFIIDGVIVLIADPRGIQWTTKREMKVKSKMLYKEMRAYWAPFRRQKKLYTQTFNDDAGLPWGFSFIGGYGDGDYELLIERVYGKVTRISSVFIPDDDEE